MDRNLVLLNRNIARLRRDVRLQSYEIEQLIAADLDCTPAAQRLMRAQADLVLFIEKRERLGVPAAREGRSEAAQDSEIARADRRTLKHDPAAAAFRPRRGRPAPADLKKAG